MKPRNYTKKQLDDQNKELVRQVNVLFSRNQELESALVRIAGPQWAFDESAKIARNTLDKVTIK